MRVVVTRPREQAAKLVDALEAGGAEVVVAPVIQIVDPDDGGAALADALARLDSYAWLVITSPNGATRVAAALADDLPRSTQVAAIGPGTAARCRAVGLDVDLVPDDAVAEGLVAAFPRPPDHDGRVLLARAAVARSVLPDELRSAGWQVDDVPAYRTIAAVLDDATKAAVREADVVAFTSSSTVEHLVAAVGVDGLPPVVACIGPATASAADQLGVAVSVVAETHTIDGLVSAILHP